MRRGQNGYSEAGSQADPSSALHRRAKSKSIPNWKPAVFKQALWDCQEQLRFPVCKLLDLAKTESRLLRNRNPFAIVVLAQIKALQTKGALRQRRVWKATLAKLGYERSYTTAFCFTSGSYVV